MSHPPPNPIPSKPPLGLFGGNVLVAAPTSWDEACFSAPAVRAIRAARPTCTLGVVCPAEQTDYWKSFAKMDRVISYGAGTSYREMLREQSQSKIIWESAILWEKNDGAELAVDLKVRQRLGYPAKDLKKWLTDEVIVDPIHGAPEHRVQHYLRFMDRLKIPVNLPQLFQPVAIVPSSQKKGIIISPESDYGTTYEWSEEKWIELINIIREKIDTTITLVSHPTSKTRLAERIAQSVPDIMLTPLQNVGGALPLAASQAMAICADSSLSHVAAHAGATVVTLFGPGDPNWRRPLGRQHAVVRRKVECSPCLLAKCPMDLRCQKELSVAHVAMMILAKYDEIHSEMIGKIK